MLNLEEIISNKNYDDSIETVMKKLYSFEREKIENLVLYKDILVCKTSDKEYNEKFIKPLSKRIAESFPELESYIYQISIINEVFASLLEKEERDFKICKEESIVCVVFGIVCQYENFIHDLNKRLTEHTDKKIMEKIVIVNQTNIEMAINSLNRVMAKIYTEKHEFSDVLKTLDYIQVIEKLSKCDFINVMCKLNCTDDLLEMVRSKEVNVIDYNFKTEEFHIKYPYDRVVKFDLPKLRQRKYDHNQLFKNIKNNLENLTILQKESISCYIEFGDNAFKIKMDLLSKEFLTIIKTIITDSLNFTEHILLDNYIDVNKLIDNVVIYGKKMKFTFKDLFYFRMAILGLANYYYLGEELFFAQKQKHSITSAINIDKKELNTIIKAICFYCFDKVIVSDVIDEIIDFYTFGSYEVKDIFCCPLIKIRDTYTISPSLIMSTNFGRVFIEHINKLEIDFKQGDIFEDNLKLMLEKHDFKVYNPRKAQLNFTTAEGHIGDIDILAIKGKYIFCAQLKNKSMPLEKREYVNYDRKLNKVLKQLKYVEEYFEQNPQKVLEFYEIEDLSKYKIIKFYVSNSFYRSGECIENIYITDMSALNVLFDYGKITIRDGEKDIIKYLRKNDKVSPEELVDFLKNPYFIWKGVYL